MAAFDMDFVPQTAAHADSTEVAAYARIASLAWNVHAMETTHMASAKSTPKSTSMAASSTARLRFGCKQTAS
jgi:hypothetical protein